MDSDLDPFDDPRLGNPWLRYAMLSITITGTIQLFGGWAVGLYFGYTFSQNPNMGLAMGIVFAVLTIVLCTTLAIVHFVANFLIGRGNKFGWVLGVVLGVLYLPTLCPPWGIVMLVGLLNAKSRKHFLG